MSLEPFRVEEQVSGFSVVSVVSAAPLISTVLENSQKNLLISYDHRRRAR
jgi:hypothetical protein